MKQAKQMIWLVVLVAILVSVNLYYRYSAQGSAAGGGESKAEAASDYTIPDAEFDIARLQQAAAARAADVKRNIFDYGAAPVARRGPAAPAPAKPDLPPPPPPEPKPPLRFFGFAQGGASGVHRVFLTDGDAVFVAQEGQVVMRRYRVLHIQTQSVEVEDATAGRRWVLPLEQP